MNNGITDDSGAEILQLYLRVLGKSKKLLLKLSTKYQRLSEVNPYSSRTLVYHHAKRLEKLGLIECKTLSRAKFCKLTERGKKLKELILEKQQKKKAKKEVKSQSPYGLVPLYPRSQPVDLLKLLRERGMDLSDLF